MFDEILRGEASQQGENRKKYKILVVDDDPNIRELILETLNGDKYRSIEAKDGTEALRLCEMERPDIVILDVMMPDLD